MRSYLEPKMTIAVFDEINCAETSGTTPNSQLANMVDKNTTTVIENQYSALQFKGE